jgi:chromosome segregation ATPase
VVEELRRELRAKERELQFVRQESCSREEMESLSSEVSCKLERDQKDKNLYIKELNNKTIEISHLQERLKLQRGEIDTLRMYLEEKEVRVAELEDRLGQVDMRKKKLENYEYQLKESHEFLRELEMRTQKLKEETDAKDAVIQDKTASVLALEQTINSYEDKLRSIESSLLRITSDKRAMQEQAESLAK